MTNIPLHLTVTTGDWGPATWAAIAAALGTVVLAFFTWRLARETQRLASETNEDINAGWRPVIGPARANLNLTVTGGRSLGAVEAPVRNVGRGPALNIRAVCFSASSMQTTRSDVTNLGTLLVDEARSVTGGEMMSRDTAGNAGSWLKFYVLVFYEDLANRQYMSELIYTHPDPVLSRPPTDPGVQSVVTVGMTSMRTSMLQVNPPDPDAAIPSGLWPVEHDPNNDPTQRRPPPA